MENEIILLRDKAKEQLLSKSDYNWYTTDQSDNSIIAETLTDDGYSYIVIKVYMTSDGKPYYTINNRDKEYLTIEDTLKDCKWTY